MKTWLILLLNGLLLTIGVGGSIFLFIALQNSYKDYQMQTLDTQCDLIVQQMLTQFGTAITISESINQINNMDDNFLLDQTLFSWYMGNTTKYTDLFNLGIAEMEKVYDEDIEEWADSHNVNITKVNPKTFKTDLQELDQPTYVLISTCWPCEGAIGMDYYGETLRKEVTDRAERKRIPVISKPIVTSDKSPDGKNHLALVIFIPRFAANDSNNFLGGISMSYINTELFDTNIDYKVEIFDEIFAISDNFNSTTLRAENQTQVLDQDVLVTCGDDPGTNFLPWLFLIAACVISLLLPVMILSFWLMGRRRKKLYHRLITHEQANQQIKIQAAAAQQANDLKSAFLANMSHEIRHPSMVYSV